MPSPLGHALGGVIAGVAAATAAGHRLDGASPRAQRGRGAMARLAVPWARVPRDVRLFGWMGMAADLDFLVGRHSRETHSVGATALVLAGLLVWTRRPRLAAAGALAYASHILLDWLGSDTVPPIGIMAGWPLTHDFYQSSWFVFDAISRHVGDWSAWVHNAWAVAREIAILGPLVALVLVIDRAVQFLQRPRRAGEALPAARSGDGGRGESR